MKAELTSEIAVRIETSLWAGEIRSLGSIPNWDKRLFSSP
jgi:hypothetical protein